LSIDASTGIAEAARKFRLQYISPQVRLSGSVGGVAKRALDIAVAATALVLLAPIMALVAGAIAVTIGGPVVYAHPRVGLRGATFRCLKFRSMVLNGDEVLVRHLASNAAAAREWKKTRKLRDDPRVTPLGRILRKTSLDELPQLFNVLRGDMSCVGPRPIVAAELERYGSRAGDYLKVRPGLTGLWQVSGRSQLDYSERVKLDCIYVRRWSLGLDIALLLRTIPAVLSFDEAA
jgi:exopolysaccharide production protein ExoY